jgi:hypothetical protein
MISEIFSPTIKQKIWLFCSQHCQFSQTTSVSMKNANLFRRKLEKIAENCDNYFDPRNHLIFIYFINTPPLSPSRPPYLWLRSLVKWLSWQWARQHWDKALAEIEKLIESR